MSSHVRGRGRRAACLPILLAIVAVVMPATTSATTPNEPPAAAADHPRLLNPTLQTVVGSPLDGGCLIQPPALELGPLEAAVEQRQLSLDRATCTAVFETGTPETVVTGDEPGGVSETVIADAPRDGRTLSAIAATSSAYYEVWWEDFVNIDTTKVRSNIAWTWNGSCVTSASGSGYFWWRSGTGWSLVSRSSFITTGCTSRRVYSDAHYRNGSFCWPLPATHTYYDNVTVRGSYNGALAGWVNRTWTTGDCLPLHRHSKLVRVTG